MGTPANHRGGSGRTTTAAMYPRDRHRGSRPTARATSRTPSRQRTRTRTRHPTSLARHRPRRPRTTHSGTRLRTATTPLVPRPPRRRPGRNSRHPGTSRSTRPHHLHRHRGRPSSHHHRTHRHRNTPATHHLRARPGNPPHRHPGHRRATRRRPATRPLPLPRRLPPLGTATRRHLPRPALPHPALPTTTRPIATAARRRSRGGQPGTRHGGPGYAVRPGRGAGRAQQYRRAKRERGHSRRLGCGAFTGRGARGAAAARARRGDGPGVKGGETVRG